MSKAGHHHEILEELRAPSRELREHIPDVYRGFAAMTKAAMAEGALATVTKELMALAIAVTKRCDGCIASHARGAARAGANAAEVAEAIGVAIQMDGGPATVYGARAYEAFEEFAADTAGPPPSHDAH